MYSSVAEFKARFDAFIKADQLREVYQHIIRTSSDEQAIAEARTKLADVEQTASTGRDTFVEEYGKLTPEQQAEYEQMITQEIERGEAQVDNRARTKAADDQRKEARAERTGRVADEREADEQAIADAQATREADQKTENFNRKMDELYTIMQSAQSQLDTNANNIKLDPTFQIKLEGQGGGHEMSAKSLQVWLDKEARPMMERYQLTNDPNLTPENRERLIAEAEKFLARDRIVQKLIAKDMATPEATAEGKDFDIPMKGQGVVQERVLDQDGKQAMSPDGEPIMRLGFTKQAQEAFNASIMEAKTNPQEYITSLELQAGNDAVALDQLNEKIKAAEESGREDEAKKYTEIKQQFGERMMLKGDMIASLKRIEKLKQDVEKRKEEIALLTPDKLSREDKADFEEFLEDNKEANKDKKVDLFAQWKNKKLAKVDKKHLAAEIAEQVAGLETTALKIAEQDKTTGKMVTMESSYYHVMQTAWESGRSGAASLDRIENMQMTLGQTEVYDRYFGADGTGEEFSHDAVAESGDDQPDIYAEDRAEYEREKADKQREADEAAEREEMYHRRDEELVRGMEEVDKNDTREKFKVKGRDGEYRYYLGTPPKDKLRWRMGDYLRDKGRKNIHRAKYNPMRLLGNAAEKMGRALQNSGFSK